MKGLLKTIMLLMSFTIIFQACSEETSTEPDDDSITIPTTYDFPSRFVEGESSVSYTGQVVRNVLIKDLKTLASSGTAATDSATMTDLFRNGGGSSADLLNPQLQTKWSDFNNTKNLSGKIASEEMWGFGETPTDQMYEWFAMVAGGTLITEDSLELNQVIGKGLSGVVGYYQGTSVYMSKIDTDDNSTADDGDPYTAMEHHWDESFGYFGAARDYNVNYTDAGLASKTVSYDSNGDGSIDYKTEYCFDWAYYAGKWDNKCASAGCTSDNDFTGTIMNAYLEGRTLIHNGAVLDDILAKRDEVVDTWERLVVASVIGYINSVIGKMSSTPTQSIYHSWAEMRAFAMALQYNSFSDHASVLLSAVTDMGIAPPAPSDYATYTTTLNSIKTSLQGAYNFADANMSAW